MAFGHWITQSVNKFYCLPFLFLMGWATAQTSSCDKPLYLTFDTGHMGVAPLIADVLKKHQVKVTFFAADEVTQEGDGTLGDYWASWWKARAAEGHDFASHTYDHVYWKSDLADGRFLVMPTAGMKKKHQLVFDAKQYCEQLDKASNRLQEITGVKPLPLFRAPGGKHSSALLNAARQCGYAHVGWADAGFLGDELDGRQFPNSKLLSNALKDIRAGDILMAHLGIWSRRDPWAPAVLKPLIEGLLSKGFCFRTLREHPMYSGWIKQSQKK